jgi:hypothetical protein
MLVFLITIVNAAVQRNAAVQEGEYQMSLESLETRLAANLAGTSLAYSYPSPTRIAAVQPPMSLVQAMTKVKALPRAVADALAMPTKHHHKKHGHHIPSPELLQHEDQVQKKGIEEALDKAKETLSNMMEETETELDAAILECKEYDAQTTATLDENTGYRATIAQEVATARGDIASAKASISEAQVELDAIKTAATESAAQCAISIKTQQDGLAILESDLQVSMRVENMTDCDDVTPGSTTTLMQCGSGWLRRFKFAGKAANFEKFTQLKSKEGSLAVQRAAKMIMNIHAYDSDFKPTKQITRHGLVRNVRLPVHTKHGLVQAKQTKQTKQDPEYSTPSPDEVNRSSPLSAEAAEVLENLTIMTSPPSSSHASRTTLKRCG